MRGFWTVLALTVGVLCARAGTVRSLVRTGTFREGLVDVRWKADYPVDLPGWSAAELSALWRYVDDCCFLPSHCSDEALEASKPARPEVVLRRAVEALDVPEEEGASARWRDMLAEGRIPFSSKDWVGVAFDGYDNEGGNGCHSYGKLAVLSREGLHPMPLEWFVRDGVGLRREILRRIEAAFKKKGEAWAKGCFFEEPEKADPDFLPTPKGVRFRYGAYSISPGCYGLPEVTVPWKDLVPFCDANRLTELNALSFHGGAPERKEPAK